VVVYVTMSGSGTICSKAFEHDVAPPAGTTTLPFAKPTAGRTLTRRSHHTTRTGDPNSTLLPPYVTPRSVLPALAQQMHAGGELATLRGSMTILNRHEPSNARAIQCTSDPTHNTLKEKHLEYKLWQRQPHTSSSSGTQWYKKQHTPCLQRARQAAPDTVVGVVQGRAFGGWDCSRHQRHASHPHQQFINQCVTIQYSSISVISGARSSQRACSLSTKCIDRSARGLVLLLFGVLVLFGVVL